ncbi:MAG: hypothetical protein Q4D61_09445 [Cardiobacteriaceae bacterium]|nr:hypothetical protein [Cardiobacteriaceae bacterium]
MNPRRITLIGTSGVGKTTLAERLVRGNWYHYSGDYRIATRYLNEAMADWLEDEARAHPLFARLIRDNALRLQGKAAFDNLRILSAYIGKLGQGGYDYATFTARQRAFTLAEKQAMYDIGDFIARAEKRHGKTAFINDAGGSIGEYIDDEALFAYLSEHTLIVYIHADDALNEEILRRAIAHPKPICYAPDFLEDAIRAYAEMSGDAHPDHFDADAFLRYVAPKMLAHRRERFSELARRYGVVLDARAVWQLQRPEDFEQLLAQAVHEQRG